MVGKGHVDGPDFILSEPCRDLRVGETNTARYMCGELTGGEEAKGSGGWEEAGVMV